MLVAVALCLYALASPVQDDDDAGGPDVADAIPFRLSEVAAASGLLHVSLSGDPEKPRLVDQLGQGMAWFDYDGDGWLDLFVPNGSTLAHWQGLAENTAIDHLYRNKGDGTFEDVTEQAGLGSNRWGAGCAVGDVDRDGDPDLYVCNLGKNQLWLNDGDGTFTEAPDGGGAAFDGVTPGAGLGDLDLDGDLDLYVSAYIEFDPQNPEAPFGRYVRNIMVSMGPKALKPRPDRVFFNDGTGHFQDVTESIGLQPDRGRGFTVLIADFTGDDLPDVFVTCDESPNVFHRAVEKGKWVEEGAFSGLAFGRDGGEDGCMGAAIADRNGDRVPDLYVTNFYGEQNVLYLSAGEALWETCGERTCESRGSRPMVGWGTGYFDLDLDGDEDLLAVNGHIHPRLDTEDPVFTTYAEAPLFYRTDGPLQVRQIADEVQGSYAEPHCARGAAFADYDEDGDVDVAITDVDGPIRLFRNDTETPLHFFRVLLEGSGDVNLDAYGSLVTLEVGGTVQQRWVLGQGSFLCQNDARAHFGVGAAESVDRVVVRWPGGAEDTFPGPFGVDRTLLIRKGAGVVAQIPKGQPMPGWKARLAARAEHGAEGEGSR